MADTRIDELRRRLERDPGSRLFAQLAEELRKAGELAEAIRVARAGLAHHTSYPSARLTLGRALLDSGDPTAARVELESALAGAPDNILASRFLAQAREQLGDLAGAVEQYQRTIQMSPGDRQLAAALEAVEARLRAPAAAGESGPETTPPRRLPPPLPTSAATAEVPVTAPRGGAPPPPPAPPPPAPQRAAAPPSAPPASSVQPGPAGASEADTEAAVAELPATLRIRASQAPEPVPLAAPRATPPPAAGGPTAPRFAPEPPPAPAVPPSPPQPHPPGQPPSVDAAGSFVEAEPPTALEEEAGGAAEAVSGASGTTAPFPSSTLAELYYQQGLVDRATDVYRQVVDLDPANERARARLHELELGAATPEERAARRRALERTIAGLETMLAAVRRR